MDNLLHSGSLASDPNNHHHRACESSFPLSQPLASIWASLPHDLLLNILSRLPLIRFVRLRTVCKSWHRLPISSPEFGARPGFALLASSQSSSQILYLDLDCRDKWRRMGLDFLPARGPVKFLASSGGLLLLGSATTGELWVVNPVTRRWEGLPEAPGIRHKFYWAMTVAAGTGPAATHYVVAVAESERREGARTAIYDSRDATWRSAGSSRSESRAGCWRKVPSVSYAPWMSGAVPVYRDPVYEHKAGAFYHVTWYPVEMVSELRVKEGEWRCRKGEAGGWAGSDEGGRPWGLMNVGPKVVMVKVVTDPSSTSPPSPLGSSHTLVSHSSSFLSLWDLDTTTLRWSMTTLVPSPPSPHFHVDKWRQFALGHGCICITFIVPGHMHTWGSHSECQPGMIYDCESSTWLSMPDLPGLPDRSMSSSLFSYTPSFYPL